MLNDEGYGREVDYQEATTPSCLKIFIYSCLHKPSAVNCCCHYRRLVVATLLHLALTRLFELTFISPKTDTSFYTLFTNLLLCVLPVSYSL